MTKDIYELCGRYRLGAELLVKNKNGDVYFVDHSFSGKLVKTKTRWEDARYGFDENIFSKSRFSYSFVSWEDDEPLDIEQYLFKNGLLGNSFKRLFP